ncbi:MAG: nitroreductase family protein [Hadesarchaea archaeon]|nr:nitroreductase family protein [Hadesarchaea archaeon]
MSVEDAISIRRSVRSYERKEVPGEKLEKVLDAARLAPSASNRQDWKFIVVRDEEKKEKICKAAYGQDFIKEAPVVIVGVGLNPDHKMSCGISSSTVDVSIAMDHMMLKATEEGLGTCWIGAFEQEKIKEILGIPSQHQVVALMPIGYPKEPLKKVEKSRKSLGEIVSYDEW